MKKNRIAYSLIFIGELAFFIWSGQPFLAWLAVMHVLVALLIAVLLKRDASRIHLQFVMPGSVQEGKNLVFTVKVQVDGTLLAMQHIVADVEIKNKMFDVVEKKRIALEIEGRTREYQLKFPMNRCGQMEFAAETVWGEDILGLFHISAGEISRRSCICYPRRIKLRLDNAVKTTGLPKTEGIMQNKKGNDPSEMFDVREYVPGDDIRSIHWKLSCKADELILREPSDPSHYRVAILADYGVDDWETLDREKREREWNTAIAAGAAIGRELVAKGERFCMIFPAAEGLKICEIENRRDYSKVLTQWMGISMKKPQGTGFRYFLNQQLEREFSRIIILGAGRNEQNIGGADKRIGITVVCAVDEIEAMQNNEVSYSYEIIEIPTKETGGAYRIIC